ncbi:MAG: 2-alkenal reductase, partial [Bradyrhizobium sp.]
MNRRHTLVLAVIAALVLALTGMHFWSAPPTSTARAVEQRGALSEAERGTIEIFERVAPSVVQVAARSASNSFSEEEGASSSGTGFIWD